MVHHNNNAFKNSSVKLVTLPASPADVETLHLAEIMGCLL